METQNTYHLLCILVLLIKLMICPERVTSSSLNIEVKVGNVYKYITLNEGEFQKFKACACDPYNTKGCYSSITQVSDLLLHTNTGDRITQFSQGKDGGQYTYFACQYLKIEETEGIDCSRQLSEHCICDTTNECKALLGFHCQEKLNVFMTWNPAQDAWVHDYNTTEINSISCCSSTTQRSTCSNHDAHTTTPERGKTTASNTATNVVTTTIKSTTTSVSKQVTATTTSKTDPISVTSSHILTTPYYDNINTQSKQEKHTEEIDEFSPAYIGLVIGVCVASATVSVLITSFVLIKWYQHQDKSSNEPNRTHQERQNETVFANNIANHRQGNAIEMTETNTSHVADAQGTSKRSPGYGNILHTNNSNPSSSSLQYIASGKYMEVDVPSARPGKVARNDAYAEVKKVFVKNPADTNNVNITEDSTYSRLHATRRDMQNLYDILPHEVGDGHGGISSPYSEVAVPKPGTVLSIL